MASLIATLRYLTLIDLHVFAGGSGIFGVRLEEPSSRRPVSDGFCTGKIAEGGADGGGKGLLASCLGGRKSFGTTSNRGNLPQVK